MSSGTGPKKSISEKSEISPEEAELIWDEYKYRHDLIWRHVIRSTVAVVALITLAFSEQYEGGTRILFTIGAVMAFLYTLFSIHVLNSELPLFENIKDMVLST